MANCAAVSVGAICNLIDPFINCNKLLVILHNFQPRIRLDLGMLHSSVKLTIEGLHLLLMIDLQILNSFHGFLLVYSEFLIPRSVELLHVVLSNCDIFSHLCSLNICSQFVLELNDISFKQSYLFHQIFVKLVLLYFAALIGIQLHFFFDSQEDKHLFVFVQDSIASHIKDIKKFLRRADLKQIIDTVSLLIEYQANVSIIQ